MVKQSNRLWPKIAVSNEQKRSTESRKNIKTIYDMRAEDQRETVTSGGNEQEYKVGRRKVQQAIRTITAQCSPTEDEEGSRASCFTSKQGGSEASSEVDRSMSGERARAVEA